MLIHLFVGMGKMGLLKAVRIPTGFHLMIAISPIARERNLNFILALRSDDQFRHMPLMTATTLPCPFTVTCRGYPIFHTYQQPNCGLPIPEKVSLADSLFSLYFAVSFVFSSGNVQCTTQHLDIFSFHRHEENRNAPSLGKYDHG